MSIEIRSERPGDEPAIDAVNCRAFGKMDEANIVRGMRALHPRFDPRFSVIAWDGDEAVGHALFTPADIRLMGETVRALAVGPVAVVPEKQKQGIGGAVLRFGHKLGRQNGFALAFLHGHPDYYPRHGYVACHGFCKVTVDRDALPEPSQTLTPWPVTEDDLPWLVERHAVEWADVDFSWQWGPHPNEWALCGINAVVWRTEDGWRVGYSWGKSDCSDWKVVLADGPVGARDIIATIKPEKLEQHPSGWLAKNVLDPAWATAEAKPSAAAMACPLQDGALDAVAAAVQAGEHPPGFTNFPLPFIVC